MVPLCTSCDVGQDPIASSAPRSPALGMSARDAARGRIFPKDYRPGAPLPRGLGSVAILSRPRLRVTICAAGCGGIVTSLGGARPAAGREPAIVRVGEEPSRTNSAVVSRQALVQPGEAGRVLAELCGRPCDG